ncbi:MAG: histidine phosphatase family protein [Saprospiraceae bacterium]
MSKLIFFRHAQASFGADNYDALSEKGIEQTILLGKHLVAKKFKFDKIFVGPLQRQQHTFDIVKEVYEKNNLSIPAPILVDGLKEHLGHIALDKILPQLQETDVYIKGMIAKAKLNPKRARANRLLIFQYFMNEWVEGKIEVEGVVSWKNFRQNVRAGLATILQNTGSGETNAAFTSGGTISSIAAESLKIMDEKVVASLNFSIRNTSYSSFFYSKGNFNLFALNELPHLPKEMVTFV